MFKVVAVDAEYPSFEQEERILSKIGARLIAAQARSEDEVIAAAWDADAILVDYSPITRNVIAALERCRVIGKYSVGVDSIDLGAATEKGIIVANVPDYCIDEVSDHALLLLLASARKLHIVASAVKDGTSSWEFTPLRPIYRVRGRTLGLIGFGRIGRALAKKAQALGLSIIAYDEYVGASAFQSAGVRQVSLPELLTTADLISVHAPLTEETRGMIGAQEFSLMKETVILVNTSRGGVIDQAALRQVIEQRRIAGVGLDVLETEPPRSVDMEWMQSDLVTVTPHMGWYSEEALRDIKRKAATAVADALSGQRPASVVNPEVYNQT